MTSQLKIQVAQSAAQQITEVSEWWQKNRPDAPDAIREELQRVFALISSRPEIGALAVNTSLPGIRRVHLARIRYHLYYRVTAYAVEVLAFWHSSRGSRPPL